MKTKRDEKHLQLRHNVWWLYYRLPKRLLEHPLFTGYPAIHTRALGTDSLLKARALRDSIIYELNHRIVDVEPFQVALKQTEQERKEFYKSNPDLDTGYDHYSIVVEDIEESEAIKQFGMDRETGEPLAYSQDVLNKRSVRRGVNPYPDKTKMLRFLSDKVVKEQEVNGLAAKTVFKIKRSVSWFLEHTIQDDIDLTVIDYDMVHDYLTLDQSAGVSGSTLNGHLYGLAMIWDRAKKSKLVSGDNPFKLHGIAKDSISYSPFTNQEVSSLYAMASGELKTLIHAAATTGARLNELLTAEIRTPADYIKPCWFIKFKDKGKTKQSTRAVPLHSSLKLDEGFTFSLNDRTVSRQFKDLVDGVIVDKVNNDTGVNRKLSFHSFRTTVITELVGKHRQNLTVVGGITGHLAGSTNTGSISTYINTDDLKVKSGLVELLQWIN